MLETNEGVQILEKDASYVVAQHPLMQKILSNNSSHNDNNLQNGTQINNSNNSNIKVNSKIKNILIIFRLKILK